MPGPPSGIQGIHPSLGIGLESLRSRPTSQPGIGANKLPGPGISLSKRLDDDNTAAAAVTLAKQTVAVGMQLLAMEQKYNLVFQAQTTRQGYANFSRNKFRTMLYKVVPARAFRDGRLVIPRTDQIVFSFKRDGVAFAVE